MKPECTRCRERFSEYLDGLLDAAGRAEADAHLAACADCRRELERWRSTLRDVAALPRQAAPEGFGAGVMARLQARVARPQRSLLLNLYLRALPVAAMLLLVFGAVAIVQHNATMKAPTRSLAMARMPAQAPAPPVLAGAQAALKPPYRRAGAPASSATKMAAVDAERLKGRPAQPPLQMAMAAARAAGGELVFRQTLHLSHAVARPEQTLTMYSADPAELTRRAIEVANREGLEVTLVFKPNGRADISIQVPAEHYEPLVAALSDLAAPQSQTLSNSALAQGAFFRQALDRYNANNRLRLEQREGAQMQAMAGQARAARLSAGLEAAEGGAGGSTPEPAAPAKAGQKEKPAPSVVNLQITILRTRGQ